MAVWHPLLVYKAAVVLWTLIVTVSLCSTSRVTDLASSCICHRIPTASSAIHPPRISFPSVMVHEAPSYAGDPPLPAELERLIFELAASSSPKSMPALLLIAQRVKIWIEPLLYEVLTLNPARIARLAPIFSTKPASFFRCVRHIYFWGASTADIARILSMCDAVINVAVLDVGRIPIILETLPLERIAVSPRPYPRPISTDSYHPVLGGITHLDILGWPDRDWEAWQGLALLPCLTHLSFGTSPSYVPVTIYRGVLAHCRTLKVLAVLYPSQTLCDRFFCGPVVEFESDPRFVAVLMTSTFTEEWETGARGGEDHWAVAERIVKARRLKQAGTDT
ncbi:hypothetical protein B0H19DRAFT_1140452 [Mycena capillaripes]|nr:hypothetical protein B0H19DRAFT_1140452 [Mycena capillaripes]